VAIAAIGGFLLELAVLIAVGKSLGVLPTLFLVVGGGIVGAGIMRSAGLGLAGILAAPAIDRQFASREAAARFLYLLAGLLFLLPGFLSDLLAVALLPAPVRRWLADRLMARVWVHAAQAEREAPRDAPVIEGEAIEIHGEIAARPDGDRRG
jgi:UPF0716 protein FxsA